MKNEYENLKKNLENATTLTRYNLMGDFVGEILETPESMLCVDKRWKSYGTWVSSGFANQSYFGEELAEIIRKAISGHLTHDEEKVFVVEDFGDEIEEAIWENLDL